jgi:tRNA pseudouridine55 synthase
MPYLLINKPAGITSHDAVDRVRKITGERTVGHAGTLDPFATGLLIIGVGRESTKHLSKFLGMDKTYIATMCIGRTSTTLDPEGEISDPPTPHPTSQKLRGTSKWGEITPQMLEAAMKSLTGNIKQIPPMHSAMKIGGKKLYELARKGIEIDRPPRAVTIHRFDPLRLPFGNGESSILPFEIETTITCSSGTYIRALARDLGEKLGTVAYLTALERTAIGPYHLKDSIRLDDLTPETWQTLAENIAP